MFDLNCDLVMSGLMNLCNVFNVEWIIVEKKPLDETSKQASLHV